MKLPIEFWEWYAKNQTKDCVSCGKIMCGHTVPELRVCALNLEYYHWIKYMNWTEAEVSAYLNRRSSRTTHKISEKVFQAAVKDMALKLGWRYYHTYNSKRSDQGFPDVVMVHAKKGRLIFAELKSEDGKVTPSQQDWLAALDAAREVANGTRHHLFFEVYVWRPADIDEIWKILSGEDLRATAYAVEQTGDECPRLITRGKP